MNKIIVIGGEGTAVNIAEALKDAIDNYAYKAELLGFANDFVEKKEIANIPIYTKIKDIQKLYKHKDLKFIYALYRPDVMNERAEILKSLMIPESSLINFIHPLSYVSASAKLGIGNVILPNCTIQNSVKIGNCNIINSNVVVEHDTTIGNSNFIAASCVLGAHVNVSNNCFIGLGTSIREDVGIEDNVFIGMNSLILKNCNKDETWYGIPAQRKQ